MLRNILVPGFNIQRAVFAQIVRVLGSKMVVSLRKEIIISVRPLMEKTYFSSAVNSTRRPSSVTSTIGADRLQNTYEVGVKDEVGHFDYLQEQIRNMQSATELLTLIESIEDSQVDDKIINSAFSMLFQLCKNEKSASSKKTILNAVGMQMLCKRTRWLGRWMDTNTLLSSAKILIFLNAPSTNSTLQIVLTLLSKKANSLDLNEIRFLHYLAERAPETSLTSALKLMLPIIFEAKIPVELEPDNINSLVNNLCYAINYKVSDMVCKVLIDELVIKSDRLTPRQALIIIWELEKLRKGFRHENTSCLITNCLLSVTESLDKLSTDEIATTVSKASKASNGRAASPFYNEDFLEAVCQTVVRRNAGISAIYLALSISTFRYVNIEYLDYIIDVLVGDPSIILNNDHLFLSIVRTLSMANYRPQKLSILKSALAEHPALTKDLNLQEIAIAADLLASDIFPSSLLSKIFSADYYGKLDKLSANKSPHNLMLIYNAVKYLYPDYNGPFPPISMVQKWKNNLVTLPKAYPLKTALESGFGGENYVISGLFHEGFHLDHGIIMRKGGFPVAIKESSGPTLLRDLHMPVDSVVVMLKAFQRESYANNTARLRGISSLELKITEKFGHPVIPIDIVRWQELQDYEKIPYLMRRIHERVDNCWKPS